MPRNKLLAAFLTVAAALGSTHVFAQTGIGSGGDVVAAYLDEVRARLSETVTAFRMARPELQKALCAGQGLAAEQEADCAAFALATAAEMASRLIGPDQIRYLISHDALYAPGPDGQLQRVAAKTDSGPAGPISFDYALVVGRTPQLMLALLGHEVGHKVAYQREGANGAYVLDNEPVGHFATGRALLDAAGLGYANLATDRGAIGAAFAIKDQFYCEMRVRGSPTYFQTAVDKRDFIASTDDPFHEFTSGIGPGRAVQLGLVQGDSCLTLSLLMHDADGCSTNAAARNRSVDLAVYRTFPELPEQPAREPILLQEAHLPDFNPGCETAAASRERPMAVEAEGVLFSCVDKGMIASTQTEMRAVETDAHSGCGG